MVALPANTPPTTPVDEPTVAVAISLLLQVPPVVVLLRVVTPPSHTLAVPVVAAIGFTVTIVVTLHPVESAYVTLVVPLATPVTIPLADPMVATAVLLTAHVPLGVALLSVVAEPAQTLA